jgi:hypothetical protein
MQVSVFPAAFHSLFFPCLAQKYLIIPEKELVSFVFDKIDEFIVKT